MSGVTRTLVVGGGIAGLTAAIALARRGIGVDLVEVKPQNAVLGVGIIQPNNALRVLDSLDLLEPCLAAGFPTDGWIYYDGAGAVLTEFQSLKLAGPDRPSANALPRPALHAILTDAAERLGVAIRLGTTMADWTEDAGGLAAAFSDGTTGRYDLVVGADGIRSPLRRRLFGPGHRPRFVGHGCWRVTLPRPAALRQCALFFGVGVKAGMIPLTEDSMYLLLISNEATDDRIDDPAERLDRLRALAGGFGGLVAEVAPAIADGEVIVYTPVEEVILPPPWHRGRIVLIGDAAHASTPYLSQGATMAMEDAAVLAQLASASDGDVEAMLRIFTDRRFERCRYVQDASRAVGEAGQITDPEACRARDARFRALPPDAPRPHEERLAQAI